MTTFEGHQNRLTSWINSHPLLTDIILTLVTFAIILISNAAICRYILDPSKAWQTRNAWVAAIYFSTLASVAILLLFRRKKSLFLAIALWTLLSVACYTALSWLWGGRFLAGWTSDKPLIFKELLSTTLAAVGGIGAVGYLVIKYREQASTEREELRQNEGEADKKLADAVQQLGSKSPQVRIAGVYALADVADTYGSEKYGVDYNKRAVEILCGYLRTVRSDNDEPVESAVFSILSNHLTPPAHSFSNSNIGPWSRYTIDLRGAILKETINFKGACIASLDCRQAEFHGKADFTDAHFDAYTHFDQAHFYHQANFTGAQFQHNNDPNLITSFVNTHFHNKATFNEAHFYHQANFTGAQFQHNAKSNLITSFVGTHFHAEVTFLEAHFHQNVDFNNSQFQQNCKNADLGTRFQRAHFDGNTYFDNAHFYHQANFTGAQFQHNAKSNLITSFVGTHFHAEVTFLEAHFHQNVDFNNSQFQQNCKNADLGTRFQRAHFDGNTYFDNAHFYHQANFTGAQFQHNAKSNLITSFVGTHFHAEVKFNEAHFHQEADAIELEVTFKEAQFDGDTYFDGTYFHKRVNFNSGDNRRSTFKKTASFQNTHFGGTANFRRVTFNSFAYFGAEGKGEGGPTKFDYDSDFQGAYFNYADFSGVVFKGVKFEYATFKDANFAATTFGLPVISEFDEAALESLISADFSCATFEDSITFQDPCFERNVTFEGNVDFRKASFPHVSFETSAGALYDMPSVSATSRTVFKAGAYFTEITFDSISFRNAWFNASLRNKKRILFASTIRLGKNGLPSGAEWKIL
nr:hypothetical protein CYJ24_08455 [Actinomyces naeslundii]